MKRHFIIVTVSIFFAFISNSLAATANKIMPVLSPKSAKLIGEKIWRNECGKKFSDLISWNQGENFVSLGIGHCIWYPAGKRDIFAESFPKLIQYMRLHHVAVPKWLDQPNTPACPWQSKENFLQAVQNREPRLQELYRFLVNTVPQQTQYLIYRLETVLPQILELVPVAERSKIQREIVQLMQNPIGVYALVDYVNFKGDGIAEYKNCLLQKSLIKTDEQVYACGWGLLQVLRDMLQAPKSLKANAAFAWAAEEALKRRVASAPQKRKAHEEKWLPGWLKRVNTYRSEKS